MCPAETWCAQGVAVARRAGSKDTLPDGGRRACYAQNVEERGESGAGHWLEKRFLRWDARERCSPALRSVSTAVAMCQAVGETRGTLSQNLCECIPTSLQDQVLLRKGGVLTQIWKILVLSNYFYFPYVTLWNITLFLNLSKCLSFAEVGKPFIK